MSVIYEVEHVTTYCYTKPVTFGPYKAMFLPRGNYSGRLLEDGWTDLAVYLQLYADDPNGSVAAWAKSFMAGDRDRTSDLLNRIMLLAHGLAMRATTWVWRYRWRCASWEQSQSLGEKVLNFELKPYCKSSKLKTNLFHPFS